MILHGFERDIVQWGESQEKNASEQGEIKRERMFKDKPREQYLLSIKAL